MIKATKVYLAYEACLKTEITNLNESWVPHYVCAVCYTELIACHKNSQQFKYISPRIWRKPVDVSECYFCLSQIRPGISKNEYPVASSSEPPIEFNSMQKKADCPADNLEVPSFASLITASSISVPHSEYQPEEEPDDTPHFPNQKEIDDLIKDLGLGKSKAELLTSRLKEWKIVDKSVKITAQRKRDEAYSRFYTYDEAVCYCKDIPGLFTAIGISLNVGEWRLFIDGSSTSIKVVLLHNRTGKERLPSLPIAYSKLLKESFECTKLILELIKYENYKWEVIGDFKMVSFLMGLQGGYTKFPCHLCLFDSRNDDLHYKIRDWPARKEFTIGINNVKWAPLVQQENILMPPLHIKLGLMKQFVKALPANSEPFKFLKNMFPRLTEGKITAGVFTGPQIRAVFSKDEFKKMLNMDQKNAWTSFQAVVDGFLGGKRDPNYKQLVETMLRNFNKMGCRMSHKLHILHSHLEVFKENSGRYSEEQGEYFHQEIKKIEERYKGQNNPISMIGDYVWSLTRTTNECYKRQSGPSSVFVSP
ncbi:uncharacterized protein LOC120421613 isoform X4 [Culex pipiens pallens]|nr:uncharacterized protein LOC120421613 isoform X4 [Culex pipiens pallens]